MAEEDNDQLQTPLKPVDLLQVAHDLYVSCEQWQKAEGIFEMEEPRARELIRQRLDDDAAFRQAFFDWFRDRAIMELVVEIRHQRKVEREHEAQRLGLPHPYPSAYVRQLQDMNTRSRAPRPGQPNEEGLSEDPADKPAHVVRVVEVGKYRQVVAEARTPVVRRITAKLTDQDE
jgi:hypothetical protein